MPLAVGMNQHTALQCVGTHTATECRDCKPLGFQYRIGVCTPAVYMYTYTINGGDLSAVDIVYGWKVKGELSIYTSL